MYPWHKAGVVMNQPVGVQTISEEEGAEV